MKRAARTDANHEAIRDALRAIPGVSVKDTSAIGDGFPDLVIGYRGVTLLMEIKDGAKAPSRKQLTPKQRAFAASWTGSPIWVVESLPSAIGVVLAEGK